MSYNKQLQNIGLTKSEADIYLACLKLGIPKVSDIAKEVDIPRTSIYVHIKNLIEKGFIKKSKKGKIEYFAPIEPEDIFSEIKEKTESFADILPQLTKMMDFAGKKPKIEFYDTKEGMYKLYEKTLKMDFKHTPYLIETGEASKAGIEKIGWDYMTRWQKRFLAKGIATQGIITKDVIPLIKAVPEKTKKIMKKREVTARVIDEKDFPFSINMYMFYPAHVFFIVPQQNFVLMVEEKNIYNSLVTMYKLLHEKAKHVDIKELLK